MIPINNSLKIENLLIEDIYYKEPDLSIWVSETLHIFPFKEKDFEFRRLFDD